MAKARAAPARPAQAAPPRGGPSTRAVHAGETPDPRTGAVNVPVHLTSTYWYPDLPDGGKSNYIYSRYTNPSVESVEAKLAAVEAAAGGSLLFSSGMAATATLCTALLNSGDTVATQRAIYGGTVAYLQELSRFGVNHHTLDVAAPPRKLPKGTRLLWMESITNPLLRVADVKAWADAAHDAGALLAVDATFASPHVTRPLELGADLAMHSATKYLGGHSDLIAGALSWAKSFPTGDREALFRVRRNSGPTLDAHAAFLVGRGMKTLVVRMERHCANALALAKACEAIRGIKGVHYPGLKSHPDHAVAKRMLVGGFGGMLTIDLGTLKAAQSFRRRLKVMTPASSLGGVESLVSLPIETSHSYSTAESRKADGVTDGLARISVGIEDIDDLIADVAQAVQ